MKAGEAYELTVPDLTVDGRRPARIEIYQAGPAGARVRCVAHGAPVPCPMASTDDDWWGFVPLNVGRVPTGWRLAGMAAPNGRMHDGREVWHVPGPPWGGDLCWAGPGAPLILHGEGERPGWLGPEVGPVTGPCQTITDAQTAADAWWLAKVAGQMTSSQSNGQRSLFEAAVS